VAGPGLGDDHLGQFELGVQSTELRAEPVGFPRRGAVANCDQLHTVLLGKPRRLSSRTMTIGSDRFI
jgi:hypothetical protein